MERPTVVVGVIGSDTHVVGVILLSRALESQGFKVVNLGGQNEPEELIKAAIETDAVSIWSSSLCGHAAIDCRGFRQKCQEAGLDKILLYVGGNLDVGKQEWAETELMFKEMGFDRVYPPQTPVEVPIADLCKDLHLVLETNSSAS